VSARIKIFMMVGVPYASSIGLAPFLSFIDYGYIIT
jgi:hypothetical protein